MAFARFKEVLDTFDTVLFEGVCTLNVLFFMELQQHVPVQVRVLTSSSKEYVAVKSSLLGVLRWFASLQGSVINSD